MIGGYILCSPTWSYYWIFFPYPKNMYRIFACILPQTSTKCRYLVIQSDLFEMVKWPFQGVKWPPTRGWKGQFESPGKYLWDTMQRFFVYTWILENTADLETAPTPSAIFKKLIPKMMVWNRYTRYTPLQVTWPPWKKKSLANSFPFGKTCFHRLS